MWPIVISFQALSGLPRAGLIPVLRAGQCHRPPLLVVRCFLTWNPIAQGPIPLAEAACALIGADVPAAKRGQAQITVERRLYDIGSILSSVGLIEKTYLGKRCVEP